MFDDPFMFKKLMEMVQQQLIWRLFRRLGVSLRDIRITCVIPFNTCDHEFAVVRLTFDELDICSEDLGLRGLGCQANAKKFRLQGLEMEIGKAIIPPLHNDNSCAELSEYADSEIVNGIRKLHMTALLNPMWMAGSFAYEPAKVHTDLPSLSGHIDVCCTALFS